MGDLVWVRFFFYLHTSDDRIFSLTYKAIVWQVFPWKIFFSFEISLQDIFS